MEQGLVVAGSAVAGGGISGFIVKMFIKNYFEQLNAERESLRTQVNELARIIENLKKEHVDKLEVKIENHIGCDRSQEILSVVRAVSSKQNKIEDQISLLSTNTATQTAEIKAAYRYIENLDKSFQTHKTQDLHKFTGGNS